MMQKRNTKGRLHSGKRRNKREYGAGVVELNVYLEETHNGGQRERQTQ